MAHAEQTALRILVVDDDEIMRELLPVLLGANGHVVTTVDSLAQAMERLTWGGMPDVILTDLHLPGADSNEVVDTLRGTRGPQTVLLGMSGSEPAQELLPKLDGFLLKPFSTDDLYKAVETAKSRDTAASHAPQQDHATKVVTAAADTSDVPVLDLATYNRFASSLPASALPDLYRMTLDDVQKRAENARKAFAAGDQTLCREEGHAIKGGCGMVGAMELRALGLAIEAGAAVDTSMLDEIAAAGTRLRRMLDTLSPNTP